MSVDDADQLHWATRCRRHALMLVLAGAFVDGVVGEVDARLHGPAALVVASAVVLWCQLDALLHGKLYERASAWLLLFTWPVGVLVHLGWTRRWRGLPLYLGLAVTVLAAAAAGNGVGSAVMQARPSPQDALELGIPTELD